ncbi:MAG TPA: porin family protein [Caulobacteraceae bacterium]|jgi:opacity protein-like surface antigen|nr:porin family protein [Caulobacteraceae bacterium]
MKSLLFAAATVAVLAAAAPALAQPMSLSGVSGYGTLGVDDVNNSSSNIGAVTGRLGARIGPYFGVEGELSGGFDNAHPNIGGARSDVSLRDQYAAYAVGFLPVLPNADLLARIGYGASDLHVSQPLSAFNRYETSWNAGVGGQYFLDGHNGVRVDYTRQTADRSDLDANVFSLAYVRKF